MRICFFIACLDGGGAERQCIALLNALQHVPEVEAHLILLGSGEHDDTLDTSKLRVHRTNVRNFASPLAAAFVARTLRRVRPDLLVSWLHPADIWSYVATRIVRDVPWVMTERGSNYPDELVFNLRKRLGCHAADAIIANSHQGKLLWESLRPRSPVQMISNMVIEREIPFTARTDRTSSFECLSVGRLEPEKNVGAMIAAFTRFAADHPQSRLVVAGKGSLAGEVVRIAEIGGVANRVEMLGFRKDVSMLMSRARLFLSFSRYEGMPNVVMEAVAAGLPAVLSDIPEHRALLGDDYPYYVGLDASPDEAAEVMAEAWVNGVKPGGQIYADARSILATMAPEKIVSAYINAFAETIARVRAHRAGNPAKLNGELRCT